MAPYSYKYPRPMLTVDTLVFTKTSIPEVLLIKRKNHPYKGKWAIPGGFVDMDEELLDAAKRELQEETGLAITKLSQFKTYGSLNRDPRGRTVSVVFLGHIKHKMQVEAADDASEAAWFSIENLPPLAFDHQLIIQEASDYTS